MFFFSLAYSRDEGNLVEEQRAFATLGRTYFVRAESLTDTEDPERKQCLDLCRKYYLKSLNICDRLHNSFLRDVINFFLLSKFEVIL